MILRQDTAKNGCDISLQKRADRKTYEVIIDDMSGIVWFECETKEHASMIYNALMNDKAVQS